MNDTKYTKAVAAVEMASAELVEQAHILCNTNNRTCWEIRNNTTSLLRRARAYAAAHKALRNVV